MITAVEATYREHLAEGPPYLLDGLDYVLSPGAHADESAADLVRSLFFRPTIYQGQRIDPFAQLRPGMMEHSIRQVPLCRAVLEDEEVRDRLPNWLDQKLLIQGSVISDVGTALVPEAELADVHCAGAKNATFFYNHPRYSYDMAKIQGSNTSAVKMLACFAGRHHMVQAQNNYGLRWSDMDYLNINPEEVDLMVATQKAVDYYDDCIDRPHDGTKTFEELVAAPLDRFRQTAGIMIQRVLRLHRSGAAPRPAYDPSLPILIADKIEEKVLAEGALRDMYAGIVREGLEVVPA